MVEKYENEYKLIRRQLRNLIKKAKNRSWSELIESIEEDPWGLPYRLVLSKLRYPTPTLTETLDQMSLGKLLDSLFPARCTIRMIFGLTWYSDENAVITSEEVAMALSRCNVGAESPYGC